MRQRHPAIGAWVTLASATNDLAHHSHSHPHHADHAVCTIVTIAVGTSRWLHMSDLQKPLPPPNRFLEPGLPAGAVVLASAAPIRGCSSGHRSGWRARARR